LKIIVYSKPGCMACTYSKLELDKRNLPFEEIDVTRDRDAEKDIRAMGFTALPVVVVSYDNGEGEAWSGLKLDLLRGLRAIEGSTK